MAATLRIITKEQEQILDTLLEGDGVVLMTEEAAKQIAKQLGVSPEELNELYVDSYDYGGEADKWVDIVRSEEHLFVDHLSETLRFQTSL